MVKTQGLISIVYILAIKKNFFFKVFIFFNKRNNKMLVQQRLKVHSNPTYLRSTTTPDLTPDVKMLLSVK